MMDESAIDALLSREPRNIEALVAKGDCRLAAGDDRGASAFYGAALRAASAAAPLPASMRPVIERAQQGIVRTEKSFGSQLEQSLANAGFPAGSRPERFQESLELMQGLRQTELELQRPTAYFYPGLPQRRYYERSELPWAAEIEAAAPAIRDELLRYLDSGQDGFSPYFKNDASRPRGDPHALLGNPDWSTLYLWEKGGAVADLAEQFPRTLAAVQRLPLPHITVRAPSILFSRLKAGARIPPHHGMLNARLICHLPLIVPPGCGFRVGGETREWREGDLLVFDDTVEHEAWNYGTSDRIILIFDVWRPELDERERSAVTALFEAVDSYPR